MSDFNQTFFIVPSYILDLPGLTLGYLKVYETMFQFWNKNQNCFLTTESISSRTKIKRSQIFEALNFFEKHNEIERIQKGRNRFVAKVNKERLITDESGVADQSGVADGVVRPSGLLGSAGADTEGKNLNKETKKKSNIAVIEYPETYFPLQTKTPSSMTALELHADNPNYIPLPMLLDWMKTRKSKKAAITVTGWKRLNKELSKCDDPIDAFEQMVTAGWQSFKAEWLNKKKSHYDNDSIEWGKGIEEDVF